MTLESTHIYVHGIRVYLRGSVSLLQGGDLTDTLFDSVGSTETLSAGDVAILLSAASTLLTNEAINNETVRG